jgi:hypothetical protein
LSSARNIRRCFWQVLIARFQFFFCHFENPKESGKIFECKRVLWRDLLVVFQWKQTCIKFSEHFTKLDVIEFLLQVQMNILPPLNSLKTLS